MALVAHKLRSTAPTPQASSSPELQRSNLSRIDFAGAATLALTIVGFLSAIDLGGQKYAWTDPIILGIFGASLVCGTIFVLVEAYWAKEPILPLGLVTKREVAASYAVVGLQIMAQMGMMYTVPLYFQITSHASASVAGAHLFPAVAGNAIGGIIAGIVIKRTRTYHPLTLLSGPISLTAYILLITRWHGHTSTLESLYIIPGGFGTALSQASGFIALTASIDTAHIAVATSGMYLAQNVGVALGMSGASAVLQASLRVVLEGKLEDVEGKAEIIDRALSDVQYVQALKGRVAELVISAYVQCLMYTHLLSVICAVLTFIAALFLKGRRL
ncbi:MAG: hypothetical protein M1819_000523 [Sarea resinae]|nr:MAG: hypothetical protein M1819_000523 [Sarea resinae]